MRPPQTVAVSPRSDPYGATTGAALSTWIVIAVAWQFQPEMTPMPDSVASGCGFSMAPESGAEQHQHGKAFEHDGS